MDQYTAISKIIKKGKKIDNPVTLQDYLLKYFSTVYKDSMLRELYFVGLYYGLIGEAQTLESIGKSQSQKLTRERVRQIIDGTLKKTRETKINFTSPFEIAVDEFNKILGNGNFLRISDLTKVEFFKDFKKNVRGLISFLNDCGIRQIAYRKQYYFYPKKLNRKNVILEIQKENKVIRRAKTVSNMSQKAKTVTYVPNEVRDYLLSYSEKKNINLNPLYETIINQFIDGRPFENDSFKFSKTKSWKARKGKAQWQQVGIYIDKDIFNNVKKNVSHIKKDLRKNVSMMSFICQAFVWHYEQNV